MENMSLWYFEQLIWSQIHSLVLKVEEDQAQFELELFLWSMLGTTCDNLCKGIEEIL